MSEAPNCGCISYSSDGVTQYHAQDSCLYPAAVSHTADLERRISEAREIMKALILSSSWAGSREIKAAEEWLDK